MGSHVQSGIYGVCEVCGLERVKKKNPLDIFYMCRDENICVYISMAGIFLYLVWVQREVCVQQLPGIVIRLAFVDLVGRVSNLHIHGPIGHPLVLEALGPTQNIKGAVIPLCLIQG